MSTLFDNTNDHQQNAGKTAMAHTGSAHHKEVLEKLQKQPLPAGPGSIKNILMEAFGAGAHYQVQHAGFHASTWTIAQPLTTKNMDAILTDTSITNIRIIINVAP